jgi:molecular chaperone DnaJ
MKDYYKILEIEENATDDEIKKSYRSLSKKYHPDLNPQGAEKFKEIAEAYETLGDKTKRAQYDSSKNNPFGGGIPLNDLFSQMFGGGGFNQQRRKSAPDKIIKVEITPLDSYFASEKVINYIRDRGCNICNGSGGDRQPCSTCNGQGFQIKQFGTGFMVQQIRTACGTCGGRGYTLIHKCYNCGGNGVKSEASQISINLPYGSDNGQFLKLQNMGDFRNGEDGDLVIQLEMVSKDGYEKMNNDLIYNLYLNLDQVQKDKFTIPHPDGDVNITAPKVFDSSKPLRLRGKGYKGGDMYVKLHVKFERSI